MRIVDVYLYLCGRYEGRNGKWIDGTKPVAKRELCACFYVDRMLSGKFKNKGFRFFCII